MPPHRSENQHGQSQYQLTRTAVPRTWTTGTKNRYAPSPRTVQSGRKTGRGHTGKGNPYLKAALGQMATGAAKTDTFLGQRYRRLIKRMPKGKALAAIERSILVIIFHLLADPSSSFEDLGADFYAKRIDIGRRTRSLVAQLEALGHQVSLNPAA